MLRAALLAALVTLSVVVGCDQSPDEAAVPPRKGPDRTELHDRAAAEIDRLRALPYAAYVDPEADDEGDGVVRHDAQRSYPGYNLCVLHGRSAAELMDAEGRVIRRWQCQPSQLWGNGELLPNGDFVVVGADPSDLPRPEVADEARYVLRFDWSGELLWKRRLTAHHDIELTPRGQLLTLTFARRMVPSIDPTIPVRDDRLTLLSQDGEVLEVLSLYDLLGGRPEDFPLAAVGPTTRGGAEWVDLFHCNSVEWMYREHLVGRHPLYELSNVLVCSRHQDRIFVVNWDRQELVWSWGEKILSGPHDAQVLENGHILVFDNGMGREWSRVIEMDPLSGRIVWRYRAPRPRDFYTLSKGSSQRLPNGNTLITNSDHGYAFEVTRQGEVVWEFRCPHRNLVGQRVTIVRMKRYEPAYVEGIQALVEAATQQPTP